MQWQCSFCLAVSGHISHPFPSSPSNKLVSFLFWFQIIDYKFYFSPLFPIIWPPAVETTSSDSPCPPSTPWFHMKDSPGFRNKWRPSDQLCLIKIQPPALTSLPQKGKIDLKVLMIRYMGIQNLPQSTDQSCALWHHRIQKKRCCQFLHCPITRSHCACPREGIFVHLI